MVGMVCGHLVSPRLEQRDCGAVLAPELNGTRRTGCNDRYGDVGLVVTQGCDQVLTTHGHIVCVVTVAKARCLVLHVRLDSGDRLDIGI